jgi:hypothetical protein
LKFLVLLNKLISGLFENEPFKILQKTSIIIVSAKVLNFHGLENCNNLSNNFQNIWYFENFEILKKLNIQKASFKF